MKQTYITIFTLLLATAVIAQPRIFVKYDAGGANDGTSWDNAYTDLQSALDDTGGTDIWVAAGTYVPGSGSSDTMSTFYINRQVNIIGGFAGSEDSPDDRNTDINKTILSGDLAGDDVSGNWDMNRTDNAKHVMVIDTGGLLVTIDAVTVSGGNNLASNPDVTIDQFLRRGAGIYSLSTVRISNASFTDNSGGSGAAVALRLAGASGSIVQNSEFYGNRAFDQGVLFMVQANDLEVKDCSFRQNENNRGALYPNACENVSVSNCEFIENENPGGFGGAFFNWHTRNMNLDNCQFTGNSAGNAGAIYSDYRNVPFDEKETDEFLIQNCSFVDNFTTGWGGGAVYTWKTSYEVLNSSFNNNRAPNTGGAIYNGGTEKQILITDSEFESNEAGGGWGGAIAFYGDTTMAIVKNTDFKNNSAATSGGGSTSGFGAQVTYEDCSFEGNIARFGGGFYSQNDYTGVTVKNCLFSSNSAESLGGGFFIGGGQNVTVENSNFEGNSADVGGGLGVSEDSLDLSIFNISASIFNFNLSESQGGAMNIGNANSNITNCLFVNNVAGDVGTGGAISTNASGPNELNVSVINSTFADNTGSLSGGIATWTTDSTAATLTLQNNALLNGLQANYAVEDGTTVVKSNGGNFSDNETADQVLTHATDINNSQEDPMFVDFFNFDYHILPGSPLMNAGVAAGAPTTDLDGNPRDASPDIGSYEVQSVDAENIFEDDENLILMPNPVIYKTNLTIDNDWKGEITIDVLDISGKSVKQISISKTTQNQGFEIEAGGLEKGIYFLLLRQENKAISKRMVKL